MRTSRFQDIHELTLRPPAARQSYFSRVFDSLKELWLRSVRQKRSQLSVTRVSRDIARVLCSEVEAPFRQPCRPFRGDPIILVCFYRTFSQQEPIPNQLKNFDSHATSRKVSVMPKDSFQRFPCSEIFQKVAGGWSRRDNLAGTKIKENQSIILPINQQTARSP